jgi:hypothetical protein
MDEAEVSADTRERLQSSLVLVHGGMAQDVGPILEMVTEKYLLRSEAEWAGRQQAMRIYDEIVALLHRGDVRGIGDATTRNFFGPIQTIIPWANNLYTTTLVDRARVAFGADFWGFWMLGGMSGGGMGFIFDPARKAEAQERLHALMLATKRELQTALPFAMEPVVYDFAINGTARWRVTRRGKRVVVARVLHADDPRIAQTGAVRPHPGPPRRVGRLRCRRAHRPRSVRHDPCSVRPHHPPPAGKRRRDAKS